MEESILKYVGSLTVGRKQSFQNMAMYPLVSDYRTDTDYLTLDEALERDAIQISEVSEQGSVSDLKVTNKSAHKVLILDGEELVGSKQNRIVNATILFKENFSAVIPVSCVEQGRWSYNSDNFRSEKRCFSPAIRAMKAEQVRDSVTRTNEYRSDQGEIWHEISAKFSRMESESPSMAYREIHEKEAPKVQSYVSHFKIKENQVGAVFLINGRIVGLEGFGRTDTFIKIFQKLAESYALDAIDWLHNNGDDAAKTTKKKAVKKFIQTILTSDCSEHKSVQLGNDIRFSSDKITGFSLIHNRELFHLSAFAKASEKNSGTSPQRMRRFSERRGNTVY